MRVSFGHLILGGSLLTASLAQAASVTTVASDSTYIAQGTPYPWSTNSYSQLYLWGNSENSHVQRALFKFDLASYAGQTVTGDATFRVFLYNQNQSRNAVLGLYEIAASNAAWVQGTGTSTTAPRGASWNYLSYDGTVEWKDSSGNSLGSTSGLGGPLAENPSDATARGYDSQVIDTVTLPGAQGAEQVWLTFTIPEATIQDWIDHPEENAGLLLRFQNETNVTRSGGNTVSQWGGAFLYSTRATPILDSGGNLVDVRPNLSFAVAVPEAATLGLLGMSAVFLLCRKSYGRES